MSDIKYKKVARSGFGLLFQTVIYMTDDHLLLSKSSTFNNMYRRFFFSDIQAIYMQKKFGFELAAGFWGLLTLGFTLLIFDAPDTFVQFLVGIFLLVFLYLFIKTLIGGPFCKVVLETAAQSVEIPALRTQRSALKFMDDLKGKVESIQGRIADLDETLITEPPTRRASKQERPLALVTRWHWFTYILWMTIGGMLAFSFFQAMPRGAIVFLVASSLFAFITGAVAVSLNIRSRRKQTLLEYLTFSTLGFLMIRGFVYYILLIVEGVDSGAITSQELAQGLMDGTLFNNADYRTWFNIDGIISGLFGLFGILFCLTGEKETLQETIAKAEQSE